MLTDNQLRDRLRQQIDRLPSGKLRLAERFLAMLEENEPVDTVRENITEYLSREESETASIASATPLSAKKWHPNKPCCGTREEWFQYFLEIEEGEFSSLDEANQEFEQWKTQHIKNRL